MKPRTLLLKLVVLFIFILTINKSYSQKIYFSYDSLANIFFLISDDKKEGEITIEGKKYAGVIYNGENDVYGFYSNGDLFLRFKFCRSNRIIIMNDHRDIFTNSENENIELSQIDDYPYNIEDLYNNKSNNVISNISLMNDKASYLEQFGAFEESISILERVISKSPDRVVAYLNIADAYWGSNEKENARDSYKKYIELMKAQGKDIKKIPPRVYERLKDESSVTAYFSYGSLANIIFSISDDMKEGEITIDGKKYTGTIEYISYNSEPKSKYDNISYNFYSNGEYLLTFITWEEFDYITIQNKRYDIVNSDEESIELYPINHLDNIKYLHYNINNIPLMAEKAYYLEQLGATRESIYVLERIISKSPDRLITYLNLADVYWGNNDEEKAKEYYKKYIELMKAQGKNMQKIPSRAYEHSKYNSFSPKYLIFSISAVFFIGFVVLIGKRKAKVKTIAENTTKKI